MIEGAPARSRRETRGDSARGTPAPPKHARSGRSHLAALFLLPTFLCVLVALGGPIASGDLFWHLSTGEWILDHGALPEADPLSHTAGERPWTLEEYGSQILFALGLRAGGLTLLRVFGTLLGLALLACVYREARRALDPAWSVLATALFATLFALKWELRPHLLSAFFVLWCARTLFPDGRRFVPDKREWAGLFAVSVVWTQLHAEAIFTVLFAIAGSIGAALEWLRERAAGFERLRAWLVSLVAATAGTLLSPLGADQHLYAVSESSVPRRFIEEWFPLWVLPGDPRLESLPGGVLWVSLLALLAGALLLVPELWRGLRASPERRLSWERLGFLLMCALLACLARRFLWLLWFPAVEALRALLVRWHPLVRRRLWALGVSLLLVWPLYDSRFVLFGRAALEEGRWRADLDPRLFPVHAADFVARAGLEGNLFHPYEWGGFLGFQLGPEAPVFLDGRTVLFGPFIEERWRADQWRDHARPQDAREVFEARDVRLIVHENQASATRRGPWRPPDEESTWLRVWADARAAVWIRRDDRPNLERAMSALAKEGVALEPERGFVEAQALLARPEWLDEKLMLPPSVAEGVRASYAGSESASARAHLERAFQLQSLGRSARWELERFLELQYAADPDARARWRAMLDAEGPRALLAAFAGGGG